MSRTDAGTRLRVLDSIRAAGPAGAGGESIARSLGVSRVAVSKHVAALRDLGYVIEAAPATGYLLVSAPDLALPWEVEARVSHPLWAVFEGGVETGSTNDDARALARAGVPEGTVVVAARQTGGRGRLGRTWTSPPGGAYVSVILRPAVPPAQIAPLALVVALGIAEGLEASGVHAGLKWPNDLRSGDGKLAGVLLEMSAESDRIDWVVAGFGLNVVRTAKAGADAAFVRDFAPDLPVAAAAALALDGVAAAYGEWLGGGFLGLRSRYEARCVLTGRDVVARDAAGTVRARGRVTGIDDEGRLLVMTEDGVREVSSGEITLRDAT